MGISLPDLAGTDTVRMCKLRLPMHRFPVLDFPPSSLFYSSSATSKPCQCPSSMDEYTPEALVNRDEPVPVLNISSKPRRMSKGSPDSAHSRSSSQSKNSIQDRLLTKYVPCRTPCRCLFTDSATGFYNMSSPQTMTRLMPTMGTRSLLRPRNDRVSVCH